jgi:hypothetical protein
VIRPVMLGLGLVAAAGTAPIPTPIGAGPMFHPGPANSAVTHGRGIGRLTCSPAEKLRVGVHLELFARGRVVIVPAGIGVAPPLRRDGVYVRSGRCSYPLRTREPTGVIELERATPLTLRDVFAVWGRPLTARRLLGFGGTVRAYVNGRRWSADPRAIRLHRHDEIVLEVGPVIPPHSSYRFPKGL